MLDEMDKCTSLFLQIATEPNESSLLLRIEEGRTNDTPEDINIGGVVIAGTRKVLHDDSCRIFELVLGTYISYSVTNESFASPDDPLFYTGEKIRKYSQSPFLEYVRAATFATDEYPGSYGHMAVICERHIIDVVSTEEPKVRLVKHGKPRSVDGT